MKQGRLSVLTDLTRLSLMTAAALLCTITMSNAQQANPEIYVNMEVLEQLDPGLEQKQVPVKLRSPSSRPDAVQPRLTSPSVTYVPEVPERAAGTSTSDQISQPPSDDPVIWSSPSGRLTEPAAETPPPPEQKAVSFPIKTKTRAETNDPSVNAISRPVPVRSGIAGNIGDPVISRPAPDFDPEEKQTSASVAPVRDLTEQTPTYSSKPVPLRTQPEKVQPAKLSKSAPVIPVRKPPHDLKLATLPVIANEPTLVAAPISENKQPPVIPPRRPSNVQKATPELVAALRAREENKKHIPLKANAQKTATDTPLPPPGPMGRKNMPAVAKPHVESEKLPEQTVKAVSDPLLGQLLEKDKDALVATIESMVAEREDGKAVKQNKKPERQLGSNIVKAEPLQRPYNVYRPQKEGDKAEPNAVQEKIEAIPEMKVAALPTPTPVAPRPRSPEEKAYISLPFATGLNEIDDKIISEIETQLLPVLTKNPASKLQIHAFASPAKDNAASARKASLARAMSVRAYLISKGIEATRMNIRALGAESDREPFDRVDLIVFNPAKKS